jgi:ElaB/YqjD/DUF883 family membrane-anchored ribosome-binding protein
MVESTANPSFDSGAGQNTGGMPKSNFSKAIDDAKTKAQQLGKDAQERASAYCDMLSQSRDDWANEARSRSGEAREKAYQLAKDGKARASEYIGGFGKMVEDNADAIDSRVGAKYGDYARSAGRSLQDAAQTLDSRELEELAEDARQFIRENPALSVGIAAAAGYCMARLFRGSRS